MHDLPSVDDVTNAAAAACKFDSIDFAIAAADAE